MLIVLTKHSQVLLWLTSIKLNIDAPADDAFVNVIPLIGSHVEDIPRRAISDESFQVGLCGCAPAVQLVQHEVVEAASHTAIFQTVAADVLNALHHTRAAVAVMLAAVDEREAGWRYVRHSGLCWCDTDLCAAVVVTPVVAGFI